MLGAGSEHSGETFQGLALAEADLSRATFEDYRFVKCDLRGADLSASRWIDCVFEGCDLSNVRLSRARIRGPRFVGCKLLGQAWVDLDDLGSPGFTGSRLDHGNFVGLKLRKAVFRECSLRDCDLEQAQLDEADFRESTLEGARCVRASLLKADFGGARDYLIDPVSNAVRGARFTLPKAQGLLAGLGVFIES